MKKAIFLFALCLMGMSYLAAQSLPGTPIQFYDVYAVMPLDDPDNENGGTGGPDPNRVIGGIDGNDLNIGIVGGNEVGVGEVVVIDPETGEIIIDEEPIVGQASIYIPESGSYTAYVTVGGTTYAGNFVVQ